MGADDFVFRLRQVDVKAEHFERQVQRIEQERDQWEKKYEVIFLGSCTSRRLIDVSSQESEDKLKQSKKELNELVESMGNI